MQELIKYISIFNFSNLIKYQINIFQNLFLCEVSYFDIPGRGFPIRVSLFNAFGKDGFTDDRISFDAKLNQIQHAWNNVCFIALCHAFNSQRVEQYHQTSIVPRVEY